MIGREKMRGLSRLVPWPTLLLVAACGGGDKGQDGPAGPGDGPTVSYELAALGQVALPANVQVEDCSPTLFKSGYLLLSDDGGWFLRLEVSDEDGNWGYEDEGEVDEDGVAPAHVLSELADRLQEGQGLDVAHRAPDLHDHDVRVFRAAPG